MKRFFTFYSRLCTKQVSIYRKASENRFCKTRSYNIRADHCYAASDQHGHRGLPSLQQTRLSDVPAVIQRSYPIMCVRADRSVVHDLNCNLTTQRIIWSDAVAFCLKVHEKAFSALSRYSSKCLHSLTEDCYFCHNVQS